MPYHRKDGTQTVDEGCLVLEQAGTKKVWAARSGEAGGWQLPRWQIVPSAAMASKTTAAWDASNVIGELQQAVRSELGVQASWMSWIADSKRLDASTGTAAAPQERLCRVYGHLLAPGDAVPFDSGAPSRGGRFIDPTELASAEERGWVRQWVLQVDGSGRPVKRGIGVAKETMFSYGHQGKAWGTYRVGAFDSDGLPVPNPLA
jgi:hypothetical protein